MEREDDSAGREGDRPGGAEPRAPEAFDEEPIDEELLALGPPPPSPRQAVFILLVLGLSVFMLVWFFADLRYLLRSFGGPRDLGEAADVHPGTFEQHAFVRLHGIPMTNRTLVFSKGVRWFSDTTRKVFPLAGRPELLVEWEVPEEQRAYRDPEVDPESARLPFDFEGRLVPREDLAARYERIWLFYDCLGSYSVRECKLCLGTEDMGQCRQRIACALEIGDDCREILSNPADPRAARVRERAARLALEEARGLHSRLAGVVEDLRQEAESLDRDLAELEGGRMIPRLEGELAEGRARAEEARAGERKLLAALGARGLDAAGLKAAVTRDAAELELVRSEMRGLVRRAEMDRGDAGIADAGAGDAGPPEDIPARLAELSARRDALQGQVDEGRGDLERVRELERQARERDEAVKGTEAALAEARSGALSARLGASRERDRGLRDALGPGAAELAEIGARLSAMAPGDPGVETALADLLRVQQALGLSQWVLVDGDVPVDSIWVVAVYVIFLLMIFSNARHLYRFWLAWRV